MSNDKEQQKNDMFGIAAYGEALNTLAKGAVDGSGAFLSRICLPAAEEFGLLLKDKVSAWRANNAIAITQKAEGILQAAGNDNAHAHPRLVMKILSEGSWIDNESVQTLWAGLLASSCTEDGKDESNTIFLNILSQITTLQANVIAYGCQHCDIKMSKHNLIYAEMARITIDESFDIALTDSLDRLDRELDHLRSIELIGGAIAGGGINISSGTVDITPTALALSFYARCNGHNGPLEEFYDVVRTKS